MPAVRDLTPASLPQPQRRPQYGSDVILALDVLDLFGALGTVDKATRMFQPAIGPQTQIIHITMGDFLVRSWAADYERLQAVDLAHCGRYRPKRLTPFARL